MTQDIRTILIVEDETPLRTAIADILKAEGFRVLHGQNGAEGLDVALSEHPDLVLLDLMMPVMDGLTMLEKLRAAGEWGKEVPVLILTNNTSPEALERARESNTPAYFGKADWDIADIVKNIKIRLGME